MAEMKLSQEELQSIATMTAEIVADTITKRMETIDKLPPLLTRKQFMQLADIKDRKCNELFHRSDFPVTRELGHPRVITKKLFEWLDKDIENRAHVNLPYPYTS